MSATAAPPGPCCIQGVKHEGPVSGEIIDYHGISTYVSGDKTSKKIILLIADIFGATLSNTQLIADDFAAKGYYVIVPDLFNGDPVPWMPFEELGKFDLPSWLGKHGFDVTGPLIEKVYDHIVEDFAPEAIGSIGYCYGAKLVVKLQGEGKIKAGILCHPSFVEESEFEKISVPTMISAAETDPIYPMAARHKTEEIFVKNQVPYVISVYSGVVHGFCVRADLTVPVKKFSKEHAFVGQLGFFEFYL
ncbi:dienelactone hydrolase [Dipodascopsis uninucleata]